MLIHIKVLFFIAGYNVEAIVRLSDEYQIEQKKEECERVLLSEHPGLERLVLAKELGLEKLIEKCMEYASEQSIPSIESYFKDKSKDTLIAILKRKCNNFESTLQEKNVHIRGIDAKHDVYINKIKEEVNYLGSEHATLCPGKPPKLRYNGRNWGIPCFGCIKEIMLEAINKNNQ